MLTCMTNSTPPDESQLVVISGAGSGIGKTTALHLAEIGYTVGVGVRNLDQGESVRKQSSYPARIVPLQFDVTSDTDVDRAVGQVRAQIAAGKQLRGIFSNAGIAGTEPDPSSEGTPMASFERITNINYLGAVRFIKGFLPLLRDSHGTVVINSAMMARIVIPFSGGYAPSKAALETWAIGLRREVQPLGVQVVLIELAGIATPMTSGHSDTEQPSNPLYPGAKVLTKAFAKMDSEAANNPAMAPQRAAELVAEALATASPKRHYIGGGGARRLAALSLLPQALQDMAIARMLNRGDKT